MRSKNPELMENIIEFIKSKYQKDKSFPNMQEIADHFGIAKSCAWRYISEMKDKGLLEYNNNWYQFNQPETKNVDDTMLIPLVGTIACGTPILAEENIESYLPIPTRILGTGKFYILRANGDSMINAGINSGDYVVVRKQDTAEIGQIVVALIDDEATLKRYYIDEKKKQIRLHPENDKMKDMYFDNIVIQGVAVKIIKDLI